MELDKIIEHIEEYNTLSIIGMDKNVGKTTVLNYILNKARGKFSLGLTSIGRDGEDKDRVTSTEKPRIYIERGTIVATAKQCLFNGDITKEILKTTGMNTPMGEVIVAKAISNGYIELGGPSINSHIALICRELRELGCQLVIVDGALSRKTSASPSVTEAAILSTGAALSRSIDKVVELTSHTVNLLSLVKEDNKDIVKLCKENLKDSRVGIIYKDGTVKKLDVLTSLVGAKEIVHNLNGSVSHVLIKGIVSDNLIEDIIKSTDKYKGVTFLVEDGTKVFVKKDTLYKFLKLGGALRVIEGINVICVTCNPKSPYGYEFDKERFLEKLRKNISIPVFDVIGQC